MQQFWETFPIFEVDNVKNETNLRDFLNFWSWQQKWNNSARLPSKMESWELTASHQCVLRCLTSKLTSMITTCWNKWDSGWFSDIFRCSCFQVIGEAKNVEFNSVGLKCLKESESLNNFGFILTHMPYPLLKYSHTAVCSGLGPMPNFAAASQRRKNDWWIKVHHCNVQTQGEMHLNGSRRGEVVRRMLGESTFLNVCSQLLQATTIPKNRFLAANDPADSEKQPCCDCILSSGLRHAIECTATLQYPWRSTA